MGTVKAGPIGIRAIGHRAFGNGARQEYIRADAAVTKRVSK